MTTVKSPTAGRPIRTNGARITAKAGMMRHAMSGEHRSAGKKNGSNGKPKSAPKNGDSTRRRKCAALRKKPSANSNPNRANRQRANREWSAKNHLHERARRSMVRASEDSKGSPGWCREFDSAERI